MFLITGPLFQVPTIACSVVSGFSLPGESCSSCTWSMTCQACNEKPLKEGFRSHSGNRVQDTHQCLVVRIHVTVNATCNVGSFHIFSSFQWYICNLDHVSNFRGCLCHVFHYQYLDLGITCKIYK